MSPSPVSAEILPKILWPDEIEEVEIVAHAAGPSSTVVHMYMKSAPDAPAGRFPAAPGLSIQTNCAPNRLSMLSLVCCAMSRLTGK